jgi:hypothetical protein
MEIWKDINEFNNEYQISNLGRIRSKEAVIIRSNGSPYKRESKILKPALDKGYLKGAVCVNKKMISYKIHKLVANYFVDGKKDGLEVNHINGVKSDNNSQNLEWVTHSENIIHAVKIGLLPVTRGSQRVQAKMDEQTVLKIYDLRSKGLQRKLILSELGITINMYKDVIRGKSWKHVLNY